LPPPEGLAVPDPSRVATAALVRVACATLACVVALLLLSWPAYGASSSASAASAAAAAASAGFEAGQRAFLELEVNGIKRGEALVYVRGTDYWVDLEALKAAGIQDRGDGDRMMVEGRLVVRISSLPGVSAVLDEAALTLRVTADPALLGRTRLNLAPARPKEIEYRRDASAFVNYATTWNSEQRHVVSLESGLTVGAGLVTAYVSHAPTGVVRGPVSVTVDARKRLQRWVVGDSVASNGALGGAAQIAGLNVSSNYELDPYFVRFPTVGLTGALSTPSTVEVYVNDRLLTRQQLPPGTFDVEGLPLPVGAGSARVVMRDAFGREQEVAGSYYLSSGLLAPGLHQYQYAVGRERLLAATESWLYGDAAAFGRHRLGLTDAITVGGRVEASPELIAGGPEAVTRLGRFGELELAGAWSRLRDGGLGYAWTTGYLYSSRGMTFGGSLRGASREYVTTATRLESLDRLQLESGLTASTRVGRLASVTVSYQDRRFYGVLPRQTLVSLSASRRLPGRSSLFLTASRSRIGSEVSPSLFAGLTLSVGSHHSISASNEYRDDQSTAAFQAQRGMPLGEGFGYRVRAEAGDLAIIEGDARYQSRWGRYELQHNEVEGRRLTSVSAAGALVAVGGQVFATRPVDQSFALVRVPGVRNVRTFLSNQEVGRTDRNGNLLVPNLLPYYGNKLSIAHEDIPLNRTIEKRELTVAPPFRGGAVATFRADKEQRLQGNVVLKKGWGTIVPSFGVLFATTSAGEVLESPLGPKGEFYLEGLMPGAVRTRVEYADVTCELDVPVPDSDEPVIAMGVVECNVP
jgi:outer membrane usher protein